MEETENRPKSVEHLKDYQFKPGQSGNPGGRPKNTLKEFVRDMFIDMTPEEKRAWLKENKIQAIDVWKMGEGLPKADVEHSGEVTTKIISVDE